MSINYIETSEAFLIPCDSQDTNVPVFIAIFKYQFDLQPQAHLQPHVYSQVQGAAQQVGSSSSTGTQETPVFYPQENLENSMTSQQLRTLNIGGSWKLLVPQPVTVNTPVFAYNCNTNLFYIFGGPPAATYHIHIIDPVNDPNIIRQPDGWLEHQTNYLLVLQHAQNHGNAASAEPFQGGIQDSRPTTDREMSEEEQAVEGNFSRMATIFDKFICLQQSLKAEDRSISSSSHLPAMTPEERERKHDELADSLQKHIEDLHAEYLSRSPLASNESPSISKRCGNIDRQSDQKHSDETVYLR